MDPTVMTVFSADEFIKAFVANNYIALTIAFAALRIVAKVTPWAWDDTIVSLLFGMFKKLRPGAQNGEQENR